MPEDTWEGWFVREQGGSVVVTRIGDAKEHFIGRSLISYMRKEAREMRFL